MALNNLEFLRRVLPWPRDDQQEYINVHYAGKADDGRPWMSGKPTNSPLQFMETVHGLLQWKTPTDIYFCLSRQRATKTNSKGEIRAAKSQENASAVKAIWLDIDVGKYDENGKPTSYETREQALAALETFCAVANLPPISAMVGSGGGLHAYLISDRELTRDEWQPYANGLKGLVIKHEFLCDAMVTADSARILRVPGTFNRKKDPPRAVELLELLEHDYDFARDLAFLRDVDTGGTTLAIPAAERLEGAPLAAFAGLAPARLGAGIEREEWIVDLDYVAPQCGFIRTALDTGGADYGQPLWNLTTLIATWSKGGREDAHRMARGYSRYNESETNELYNRKLSERAGGRLGPPHCTAIQAAGCTACATCPLLSLNKTPLHHVRVPERVEHRDPLADAVSEYVADRPARAVARAGTPVGLIDADLPAGYVIRDGIINAVTYKPLKGGDEEPVYSNLFLCTIHEPWAQKEGDDKHALNFTVSTDGVHFKDCTLSMGQMEGGGIIKNLLEAGVAPNQVYRRQIGAFFVAWIKKLHAAGESRQATRMGWVQDPATDKVTGFCFGGHTYYPDGTQGKSSIPDAEIRFRYTPKGSKDVWMQCCKAVTDQHRAGLEVLVAVGFASPLMLATGQYNGTVCAVSESGAQKTCAARTGVAIWGNPKVSKETPKSTARGALNKMGQLRNLPLWWDEIQDAATNVKMYDTLFEGMLGVEGSRLTADLKQQHRGDWQLLTMICTNNSFADYVAQRNSTNSAGLVRVLEWFQEGRTEDSPGKMLMADADALFGSLDGNFGRVGEEYARFLIMNWDKIAQQVLDTRNRIEAELEMQPPERNWGAVIATIIVAAELANKAIGCEFHLEAIKTHLYDTVRANRARVKEEIHAVNSLDNANDMLTAFLKAQSEHTLITISSTLTPGKVETVARPNTNKAVQVQWDAGSGELRMSKARFREWAAIPADRGGAGLNPRRATQSLRTVFGATERRHQLGVGTQWVYNQEFLIIIPLADNPILMSIMATLGGKAELPPGATPANPGGFNVAK